MKEVLIKHDKDNDIIATNNSIALHAKIHCY